MTTIHIIDDDIHLGDALGRNVTRQLGWHVVNWNSGDAFLARVDTLGPSVVLADHNMPGKSGVDVLDAIAGDARFVTVLMTGAADIRMAVSAFKSGAINLIEKPFETPELMALLEAAGDRLAAARPRLNAQRRIARLSPRERDVLDGMLRGLANKVIAMELGISPRTIEVYRASLLTKLHANSVADVLQLAFTAGLVPEAEGNRAAVG
jgi:two-component system response regulator FixJ